MIRPHGTSAISEMGISAHGTLFIDATPPDSGLLDVSEPHDPCLPVKVRCLGTRAQYLLGKLFPVKSDPWPWIALVRTT